ncbi:hypothetical protein AB0N07_30825 [Streptomyces sp. NPDC051172]|uniref:hypothetical protein n=1 Tax=Streptomyces sp. NPDC051172 TaxID=3155796 RepID=UPI00342CF107
MDDPTDDLTEEHLHENDLAPLLAAWDLAHPVLADPERRHPLDEISRPRTTQAFHRLAAAACTRPDVSAHLCRCQIPKRHEALKSFEASNVCEINRIRACYVTGATMPGSPGCA